MPGREIKFVLLNKKADVDPAPLQRGFFKGSGRVPVERQPATWLINLSPGEWDVRTGRQIGLLRIRPLGVSPPGGFFLQSASL